jgi:hypothetical protein
VPRLIWHHNNFVSAFEGRTRILEDLSGIRDCRSAWRTASFAGDIKRRLAAGNDCLDFCSVSGIHPGARPGGNNDRSRPEH